MSWEEEALREVEKEILEEDPVMEFIEAVRFRSKSKGKGRKRKRPKEIILIRPRGGKRWFFWNGGDDHGPPWDVWATEIFSSSQTEDWPGDSLRRHVVDLLDLLGKF